MIRRKKDKQGKEEKIDTYKNVTKKRKLRKEIKYKKK